jgi:transcriptional regulator of heat shock response
VAEEVSVKQKIWDHRHQFEKLLKEATKALAEKSRTLAVAATEEGDFYYAGTANILDFPEFYDIDLTKSLLSLLDRFDYWQGLFSKAVAEDPFYLLLGEELGEPLFEPCGFLYTRFESPRHKGIIGIVGPCRFRYSRLIPLVRHFGELITEMG